MFPIGNMEREKSFFEAVALNLEKNDELSVVGWSHTPGNVT
ncbi:hypothetical protein [uncultured Bacteroides sp.]|nr:hypothetical protein [uncultured Bacteroides sp.]